MDNKMKQKIKNMLISKFRMKPNNRSDVPGYTAFVSYMGEAGVDSLIDRIIEIVKENETKS